MAPEEFKKKNCEIRQIALVDDDQDDRYIFKEAFEELKIQAELLLFNNGLEFVEYLESGIKNLPELIFLDLNMPMMNGIECLKHVRKSDSYKDIFIAIYSTSCAEKDMEVTHNNGANLYIKKPNNFGELIKAIDRAIEISIQHMVGSNKDRHFPMEL